MRMTSLNLFFTLSLVAAMFFLVYLSSQAKASSPISLHLNLSVHLSPPLSQAASEPLTNGHITKEENEDKEEEASVRNTSDDAASKEDLEEAKKVVEQVMESKETDEKCKSGCALEGPFFIDLVT